MSRLLIPSERRYPEPTGDGLEGLPQACWTIYDCAAHRCMEHSEVEVLNDSCEHDGFVECGACAFDAGVQKALLRNPFRRAWRKVRGSR